MFDTGIRPAIDDYLAAQQAKQRDYGDYWSASSAGYCHRKLIFERLGVPPIERDSDARRTRVFESGNIFHSWVQGITKKAGLSIAQELELQDDDIMVRGHVDDIISIDGKLMLYDYKTQHSGAFTFQKNRPISHYHEFQIGTYLHMLRHNEAYKDLVEARVMKISKDDLRMAENQIFWTQELDDAVCDYWNDLNDWWERERIPPCTCADYEGGFMSREKFNPYFFNGQPCSLEYYEKWKLTKEEEV